MSEETLKHRTGKRMGAPPKATMEEKAAMYGVLSLYQRNSKDFRQKRQEYADKFGVTTRCVDYWFDAMFAQLNGISA